MKKFILAVAALIAVSNASAVVVIARPVIIATRAPVIAPVIVPSANRAACDDRTKTNCKK